MVLEFLLRHHERTGSENALQPGRGHLRGDGPRRHVRPARRRVRPVLGRRGLGHPALREDALRQRPAGPGLCAPVAPDRRSALARRVAGQTCDWMLRELRTAEGGLAASLDADSEGRGGQVLRLDTSPAQPRSSGPTTRSSRRKPSTSPRRGRSSMARACSSSVPDPGRRGAAYGEVRTPCWPPGAAGSARPGRQGGRGLERAWRIARWPSAACCSPARTSPRPRDARHAAGRRAPGGGAPGPHLTGQALAGTAGALDDYACAAEGFLTLSGVTGEARWLDLARPAARGRAGLGSATARAASTTRPPRTSALIFRPADPADSATPSGAFAVAGALLGYSALTGSARHRRGGRGRASACSPASPPATRAAAGMRPGRGRGLAERPGRDRRGRLVRTTSGPAPCTGPPCTRAARRRPRPRRRRPGDPVRHPAARGLRPASTAPPPPTSAASSPARPPSPPPASSQRCYPAPSDLRALRPTPVSCRCRGALAGRHPPGTVAWGLCWDRCIRSRTPYAASGGGMCHPPRSQGAWFPC